MFFLFISIELPSTEIYQVDIPSDIPTIKLSANMRGEKSDIYLQLAEK